MKERVFLEEFESLYFFHGNTENWIMQNFHFHKQYEILLFLGEEATFEVGKNFYHAKAGDLFLINNKEYHRTNSSLGKSHSRYVLMFDPDMIKGLEAVFDYDFAVFFENRSESFVHKINLRDNNLHMITAMLDQIGECISQKDDINRRVRIRLLLLELLLEINELYNFFVKEKENEDSKATTLEGVMHDEVEFKNPILYRQRIEEIKIYIQDNIYEKLELDEIANQFYISRYYLSRYFKKETGFTVIQYITNQKIRAAKKLLKAGLTVTEVSEKLAYNSDSHFISIFKKNTGTTPKQYSKIK